MITFEWMRSQGNPIEITQSSHFMSVAYQQKKHTHTIHAYLFLWNKKEKNQMNKNEFLWILVRFVYILSIALYSAVAIAVAKLVRRYFLSKSFWQIQPLDVEIWMICFHFPNSFFRTAWTRCFPLISKREERETIAIF